MRRFAVTDIHGCLKTFNALLDKIAFSLTDELYLLGDYIDRGPDSKGVIDRIMGMQQDGFTVHCLQGNHEEMFLAIAAEKSGKLQYFYPGLVDTLLSYECSHPRDATPEHLDFMSQMEDYFEVEEYILVHGGLNFFAPDPLEDRTAMHWERAWYENIDKNWLQGRIILHGHTPQPLDTILQMSENLDKVPALDLDSGCVFQRPGMRHLTAFDMTNRKLYFQGNVD